MSLHFVATLDELEASTPRLFSVAGRSIGLIRADGAVYAVRNVCPHKRAPICRGTFRGTMLPSDPDSFIFGMEEQVLRCPWHGWEFDLTTGKTLCGDEQKKLTLYPITIKENEIFVDL